MTLGLQQHVNQRGSAHRAAGPLRSTWRQPCDFQAVHTRHCSCFKRESLDSEAEAAPPEAADTQSSTSRLMPRLASYRRSFSLPVWWGGGWADYACLGPPMPGPAMHAWARYACLGPQKKLPGRREFGQAPTAAPPTATTSTPSSPRPTCVHHPHHVLNRQARLSYVGGQHHLAYAAGRHPERLPLLAAGAGR